ncbi:MAG TPA: prepilin-type N-terminal cleavage/methylation domain-containing protein [Leptospiraceae bacterium]|nr:prepilin-type N-terminal cleavage/methylation domain-containing protein [Leptospiraceae bacterium]HMW08252.1 prepilin-type N-terminal cleavage/methylation domain-containing protein [Leptospiraceae bacterium]HMX35079.1 prepilin-type N-terminal cleavage/methylation domain-containing protein [Leptospiraceae bacterium]HMY34018.1 prepilin-type N-terminal cleavage/methylation domain-containing protein [Leptospiraceae bacterium]HMZ66328.1 prepilin-type N-terminal cleavage/methylation domain-contain
MKTNKLRQGFTLIEISIALAIAASAIVFTFSLISKGLSLQRQSVTLTNAVFLAKIKMAQIDASPKLETTSSKGDIPGYEGYRYETEIKEEELDLLKLSEQGGNKKKTASPDDLLGSSANSRMDDLLKKRGKTTGSKTGGLIKVFRITVKIFYPVGYGENVYTAETLKSSTF